MKKQYLECGKIINTHGVAGTVKIDPWCDFPETLAQLKKIYFLKNGKYEKIEGSKEVIGPSLANADGIIVIYAVCKSCYSPVF